MEVKNIIEKIAQYRNKKGYTYENMADELDLTLSAYRKIETGETKLTVERLFRISSILEQPISDFLDFDKNVHQQINYGNENIYRQQIEHFYQDNKDINDQLIKSKDELIDQLKKEIIYLKGLMKTM